MVFFFSGEDYLIYKYSVDTNNSFSMILCGISILMKTQMNKKQNDKITWYILVQVTATWGRFNPSNAEATFVQSARTQNLWKPSKPCCVGIN